MPLALALARSHGQAASARLHGLLEAADADPRPSRPGGAAAPILLTVLAAALRLPTLGQQSLWYDEAFTPVHVFHPALGATLHAVAHTENAPPLWYVLEWAVTRVLGTGAVDLRLISALAGIAAVPIAWAIGRRLAGPRAALLAGLLVAVNPLFVWYSQEARAYGLYVFMAALAMLCFVRALQCPTRGRLLQFGLSASAALATHYFAVFLLAPMVAWLTIDWMRRRGVPAQGDRSAARYGYERADRPVARHRDLASIGLPVLTGLALIPLLLAQGGHGTQWIGRWALASRLEAIPQYYLTGYSGASLGHGVELLIALIALAGMGYGLWRVLTPTEERGALLALVIAACGVLAPVALALVGVDYLAPRNLVAAMVPLSVLLGIAIATHRAGTLGLALGGLLALAFLAIAIDVNLSPRLQRGDWSAVAKVLRAGRPDRAITTVELGSAPLQYYLRPLRNLPLGASVTVNEIDETGYAPLRSWAGRPPAPGFRLLGTSNLHGLIVYRFVSHAPVTISQEALRRQVITSARPEVLVPGDGNGH